MVRQCKLCWLPKRVEKLSDDGICDLCLANPNPQRVDYEEDDGDSLHMNIADIPVLQPARDTRAIPHERAQHETLYHKGPLPPDIHENILSHGQFNKQMLREALEEARLAGARGECPVGAVMTYNGALFTRAGNEEIARHDPTAHAEILVLRQAGALLGCETFPRSSVYTTFYPCPMCLNALLQAGVTRVVYAARCSCGSEPEVPSQTGNIHLVGPFPAFETEGRGLILEWARNTGRGEAREQAEPWP